MFEHGMLGVPAEDLPRKPKLYVTPIGRDTLKVAKQFFEDLSCPRSLTCYLMLEYGMIGELLTLPFDPLWYDAHFGAYEFDLSYYATSFLKKYEGADEFLANSSYACVDDYGTALYRCNDGSLSRFDTLLSCAEKVVDGERQCAENNLLLRSHAGIPDRFYKLLIRAQRHIANALGNCPSISDVAESIGSVPWPQGSTLSLRHARRDLKHKWVTTNVLDHANEHVTCTTLALPHWRELLRLYPRLSPGYPDYLEEKLSKDIPFGVEGPFSFRDVISIVEWDEFDSVPKTALERRAISIQPSANLMLQKMHGKWIAKRIRAYCGIEIEHQADVNRQLVADAFNMRLCTIDLRNASSTICTELVRILLIGCKNTEAWYRRLNELRCHSTLYRDKPLGQHGSRSEHLHPNQMWSAMGNGYTFELETLIFWCLAKAVIDESAYSGGKKPCQILGVFGDDIILGAEHYSTLVSLLQYCGFKVNTSKSFSDGQFFESCGHDYFAGRFCRPVFLRNRINDHEDFRKLANRIRHLSCNSSDGVVCDSRFSKSWRLCANLVPREWRNIGPSDLGDQVIWGNPGEISAGVGILKDGAWLCLGRSKPGEPIKRSSRYNNRMLSVALSCGRGSLLLQEADCDRRLGWHPVGCKNQLVYTTTSIGLLKVVGTLSKTISHSIDDTSGCAIAKHGRPKDANSGFYKTSELRHVIRADAPPWV